MQRCRYWVSGFLLASLVVTSSGLALWVHHRIEEGHNHDRATCPLCQESILTSAVVLPVVSVSPLLVSPLERRAVLTDEHVVATACLGPSLPRGPPNLL